PSPTQSYPKLLKRASSDSSLGYSTPGVAYTGPVRRSKSPRISGDTTPNDSVQQLVRVKRVAASAWAVARRNVRRMLLLANAAAIAGHDHEAEAPSQGILSSTPA